MGGNSPLGAGGIIKPRSDDLTMEGLGDAIVNYSIYYNQEALWGLMICLSLTHRLYKM